MERTEKRVYFLQNFISDLLSGNRASYAEYAEKYGETKDVIRKWWRTFKESYVEDGNYLPGHPIDPHWVDKAKKAISLVNVEHSISNEDGVPLPYEGVRPKKVWEGQTKGGGTKLLHSYEFIDERERTREFEERLLSAIKSTIEEGPLVTVSAKPDFSGNNMLLNVYTTDKHVGADTKEGIFGNKYNTEEYQRRMDSIEPMIANYVSIFGPFAQINIIDLGDGTDGIDGQTARKGHVLDQNLDTIQQYEVYLKSHKKLFDSLANKSYASKLKYLVASNDNHNGFFMHLTARAVEEYINAAYPFIETRVERKFMFHEEFGMHKFIFCHGKDDRVMKYGFPIRLDKRAEDIINDYIAYNALDIGIDPSMQRQVIHFIKGDLHQSAEEFSRKFRYKNIMSMYGPSNYIQLNYGNGYKGFEFEMFCADKPHMLGGKLFLHDKK